MSEITKTVFGTKYNDSGTGLFKDAKPIVASDVRGLVTDIMANMPFWNDLRATYLSTSDQLAYTGSMATTATSYTDNGRLFLFQVNAPNIGAVTIDIDSIGAVPIYKVTDDPVAPVVELCAGDVGYSQPIICIFFVTYFIMMNPPALPTAISRKLTASEIINSFSSPVELVPASGAGYMNMITSPITASTDYTSAVWATNTNSFVTMGGLQLSENMSNLLTNAADSVQIMNKAYNSMSAKTTYENVPILFSTQTGNPTGGGTNTLKLTFYYRKIKVP